METSEVHNNQQHTAVPVENAIGDLAILTEADHSPPLIAEQTIVQPQGADGGCSCNSEPGAAADTNSIEPSPVYAIGTIHARFPSLAVEKEFLQSAKDHETVNLTDQQVLHSMLSHPENRYLAREVCWVFTVENIDTYLLQPNTDAELTQLIDAIQPSSQVDANVVIGLRGPIAPPNMCNGLQLPIVFCDRIYSFGVQEFVDAIPKPKGMKDEPFRNAARALYSSIQQLTDNVGELDEHRAINYVALRYSAVYAHAMEMMSADKTLSSVDVHPSRLASTRKIYNVILSYIDRNTDVTEKYFIRVDVTEKWPFLVSKLQAFYDR